MNLLGDGEGSPIMVSNCTLIDYLVEPDGVQITTRLKALTYKETRVYSLKNLQGVTPEQAAAVIRQSIRPWSWRSRIDDLGDQLRGGGATAKAIGSLIKPTIQEGPRGGGQRRDLIERCCSGRQVRRQKARRNVRRRAGRDARQCGRQLRRDLCPHDVDRTGNRSLRRSPTGSIQTLPGKLIITQSQAAHREIAELLEQLSEE